MAKITIEPVQKRKVNMKREYRFPVFGTQGGGLVRYIKGICIFVEKPDIQGLDVGDIMPSEWSIVPANDLARIQMEREGI